MSRVAEARSEVLSRDVVVRTANLICSTLEDQWGERPLVLRVETDLRLVGKRGAPLICFTIVLDLPQDFDVSEWPAGEVRELKRTLRAMANRYLSNFYITTMCGGS